MLAPVTAGVITTLVYLLARAFHIDFPEYVAATGAMVSGWALFFVVSNAKGSFFFAPTQAWGVLLAFGGAIGSLFLLVVGR